MDTSSHLQFPLVESSHSDNDVILIAPWKLYQYHPTNLSKHLTINNTSIVPDKHIYMMTNSDRPDSQLNGKLDQFCNMWVITCNDDKEIDVLLYKLGDGFSVLHVLLVERHVFTDSIKIPMLIFVNNRSQGIESLKSNLNIVKESNSNGKQFSFEVDYGPSIESWAIEVLKRDFICVGGRFCVTSDASFNHALDWGNLLSCLPCLPCGLVAGSVYRANRKLRYLEKRNTPHTEVMLVGSRNCDGDEQRTTLIHLMKWATEATRITRESVDRNKNGYKDRNYENGDSNCCDIEYKSSGENGTPEHGKSFIKSTGDRVTADDNDGHSYTEHNPEDSGSKEYASSDIKTFQTDPHKLEIRRNFQPSDNHEDNGPSENASSDTDTFQPESNGPHKIELTRHFQLPDSEPTSSLPTIDSDSIFKPDNPLDFSALLRFLAPGKITEGPTFKKNKPEDTSKVKPLTTRTNVVKGRTITVKSNKTKGRVLNANLTTESEV